MAASRETSQQNTMRDVPITQAHTLFTSFANFLTVAIHTVIYYRNIYPKETFLSAKAYNLPVHQSRHPKVCAWIQDAVDAVMAQIAKGSVSTIAVVIHSPLHDSSKSQSPSPRQLAPGTVLERWIFDVGRFPAWPGGIDALRNFRGDKEDKADEDEETGIEDEVHRDIEDELGDPSAASSGSGSINWTDVDEQLRGALTKLGHAGEKMDVLPQGCTFTVAVELKEESPAPIGHPQPWIPSQPDSQPSSVSGRELRNASTVPIRAVTAGPLFFECWVEEGKAKETLGASLSQSTASS